MIRRTLSSTRRGSMRSLLYNQSTIRCFSFISDRDALFHMLKLSTFNKTNLAAAYQTYLNAHQSSTPSELVVVSRRILSGPILPLPPAVFEQQIMTLAEKLDTKRMIPLGLSYLGVGLSIGVIIPVLPMMVTQLGLPTSTFGLVVAAFGLARILGNIPSASLVRYTIFVDHCLSLNRL